MSSVVPDASLPVAGWYPDPEYPGNDRWWDGSAWTDYRRPDAAAAQPRPGNTPALVGFILAASSVLFPFVLNSFAGGIVAAVGLGRARRLSTAGGVAPGRGFALAGVLIGFIWGALCLLGLVLLIAFWIWIAAVSQHVSNSSNPVI